MWFVSPIANQDILNQYWKCVSNFGQNITFSETQKSVHLHCYGSFKWRLHVFSRQLSNSHHCLVYVLLEDVNQISRTEKCHFAFYAFHIFHEQRFQSFTTSKKQTNKQTNKQNKTNPPQKKHQRHPYIMWISGFYFVTVLTYRHTRKNVRKLKFKIGQYVIFFHASWLVFFIFNFIKISIV